MTTEAAALAESLRELAKELWPNRRYNLTAKEFSDDLLLLGVLFQRQLAMKIDKLPTRYAEGGESQPTARPTRKPPE